MVSVTQVVQVARVLAVGAPLRKLGVELVELVRVSVEVVFNVVTQDGIRQCDLTKKEH